MKITVSNQVGWLGGGARLKILINGQCQLKLRHTQTDLIQLSSDQPVEVQAALLGTRSNKLTIHEDAHITVQPAPYTPKLFIFFMILLIALAVLPLPINHWLAMAIVTCLYVSLDWLGWPTYQLTVN